MESAEKLRAVRFYQRAVIIVIDAKTNYDGGCRTRGILVFSKA